MLSQSLVLNKTYLRLAGVFFPRIGWRHRCWQATNSAKELASGKARNLTIVVYWESSVLQTLTG